MKTHNPLNHMFEWGLIRQHSGGTAEQIKRSPGKKVTSGSTCAGTCCYFIQHEYIAGKLFYNISGTFFYLTPGNRIERWNNYHDNCTNKPHFLAPSTLHKTFSFFGGGFPNWKPLNGWIYLSKLILFVSPLPWINIINLQSYTVIINTPLKVQ